MHKNLVYTSTKDLTPEQWEEMRKGLKTIGGSDAATIIGLNEYDSPFSLWSQKTGRVVPADISDKESVKLGHDLEEYVAKRWTERTGKKLRRCNAVITNPDYPFAHANVDRLVVGEDSGFEAKTTASWEIAKQCRDGKFPDRFYAQCCHYLMVTGADRWYLGVLVFGVGFFDFVIERNQAEIDALAGAEEEFWANVSNDTAPALDGTGATTEAIKTIYADSVPGSACDLTCVSHHIDAYNALGKQIKDLEEMQKEHENCIKDFMGESERGSCGNTSISWKKSSRKNFDKAAYEAANGKIPDRYYKTSEARSFRVTVKK